jgi:hypothetical protein
LLVLPDHQRNGLEQQYAICYEPTLSEITAAEFGGCYEYLLRWGRTDNE